MKWISLLIEVLTLAAVALAARFTYGQWTTAARQEQEQLRAYVFEDTTNIVTEEDKLIVTLQLKNFGQTPAYDVVNGAEFRRCNQASLKSIPISQVIMPPGRSHSITVRHVDSTFVDAVKNLKNLEQSEICFYGAVGYKDIFERDWCYTFDMAISTQADGKLTLSLRKPGNTETSGRCELLAQ